MPRHAVAFVALLAMPFGAAELWGQALPVAPATSWSETELVDARRACGTVLAGFAARYEPHPPFRSGPCGAAASVKLVSIGRERHVVLSPPPVLTCQMAAALSRWADTTLQPVAMTVLGEAIARLEGLSSYQCRNQIGDPASAGDLSEHALANAIDISTLVTARGRRISIARGWGALDAMPRLPLSAPLPRGKAADASFDGVFLRAIHAGACREFSTVIGPQSNAAHRDHLHFDLGPSSGPGDRFCE